MPDPQDVTDAATVTAYLAAGGYVLTSAQAAVLDGLVTEASQEVCRWCRRYFAATDYDRVLSPFSGQPDKGEADWLSLPAYPVISLSRLMTGWDTALTIRNTDAATNQLASVAYDFTGDPEIAQTRTGIVLKRVASGVATTNTIAFADATTVAALAAAANGLGNGWSAAAQSQYALWPTADLYGPLTPQGCLGSQGASIGLFATPLDAAAMETSTGNVTLPLSWNGGVNTGPGGWWNWPNSSDVPFGSASLRPDVRVSWRAGWVTVPMPVQRACAELIKATLDRLSADGALKSETAKDYSYTLRDAWEAVPPWVTQTLGRYKVLT